MVGALMAEDREPGAVEQPEDEPFDVVRANSSLDEGYNSGSGRSPRHIRAENRRTAARANHEIGDLPALSRSEGSTVDVGSANGPKNKNKSNGDADANANTNTITLTRNVTGGRSASRSRPMSPPSRAGLDDPEIYHKRKAKQHGRSRGGGDSDGDSDDDELSGDDETGTKTNSTSATATTTTPSTSRFSRGNSYRSEMPMDERREYEDEMKALALCDLGEGSQALPEFCDTALTAVNEMCSGGLDMGGGTSGGRDEAVPASRPARKPSLGLRLGEKHNANGTGVEEQTAIEVEYVEPLYRGKNGDESDRYASPRRKNALLKAMTRKAKDDWKGKGKRGTSGKQHSTDLAAEAALQELADSPGDNVYATFSNAEKRKFLQLINGGNSPFEATSRVLKERMEASNADTSVADTSVQSDEPIRSPPRSGKKSRKLAFWKKSPRAAKEESAPGSAPNSNPSTPRRVPGGSDGDEIAGTDLNNNNNNEEEEIYEDDASSGESSCEKVADEIKQFLKDEAESVKAESVGSPRSVKQQQQEVQQPQGGGGGEDHQGFEKSGISYYDAVRKDRSIEEEDDAYYYNDGQYPDDARRNPRKIKLPKGFGGFSKFREKNRATLVPGDEDRSIPPPGTEQQQQQALFVEEKKAEEDPRAASGTPLGMSNQMPDVDDDETPTPKSPEEIVDDLNMDAYLGATEAISRVGNSGSFDAISVVSGKSYKTSGTNFTTQSTRSRRPGQAKIRLEQEKNVLNISATSSKTHGWQESIEAMAARTGKVWDPVTGWKDYVDPKELENANASDGFYSQSINVVGEANERERSPVVSSLPSDVAQLPSWKDTQRKPPTTPTRSAGDSRKPTSPRRRLQSGSKSPKKTAVLANDEKGAHRGWAATMKAATAKLNIQGKNWDPEKGWVGLSAEEAQSVSEAGRLSHDIAVTSSSDMQDFGTSVVGTVQQLDEIANKQDKSMQQFLSEDEEAEASTNDGDMSSSKNSGRYIQIAESGSVKEYERQNRSRPVIVRKQNLNQHDADFFPEGSSHHPIKGPVDLDDVYEQENASTAFKGGGGGRAEKIVSGPSANAMYQKIYESQSAHGNGSFDAGSGTDFSWDADEATEILDNRKAVPRLKIKIRDSSKAATALSQSEASFDTAASIPKLKAPRRDTSPIRSGNNKTRKSKGGTPEQQSSPAPLLSGPSADSQEDQNIFRDREEEEEPQFIEKEIAAEQPVKDTSAQSPNPTRTLERISPKVNSTTKSPAKLSALHKMWEKKTKSWDKDKELDLQQLQDNEDEEIESAENNPEWKSFLAKKVLAETAAANPNADDRDSVFDFDADNNSDAHNAAAQQQKKRLSPRRKDHGEPDFDDLSELSPIRHDADESDSEYGGRNSEVHSEASTSVLQGTTFLQRLQACAAPIVTQGSQFAQNQNCTSDDGPISSRLAPHLAFLRNKTGIGSSPDKKDGGILGRPDVISETWEDETATYESSVRTSPSKSEGFSDRRARSNPRSSRPKDKDDMSSVISDGFGAQSAYLEAIAMKAATGGSSKKKKKKRSGGSEAGSASSSHSRQQSPSEAASGVSGSSAGKSGHSDKFQKFLDRRASKESSSSPNNNQLPDHKPPSGRAEVSNRAEKYASEKVDEMMDSMAERDETGAFPTLPRAAENQSSPGNDASRMAAEELAAARVEVMMQTLSSQNLEDHEAEI